MIKNFFGIACLTTICFLLNGCDRRTVNKSAFDKAEPEIRQIWESGLTASKSNNYLAAQSNLVSLLRRDITPEQLVALQDALAVLHEHMFDAASKGDASALKAVEAFKTMAAERTPQGRVQTTK